jgi:hypothetical protein
MISNSKTLEPDRPQHRRFRRLCYRPAILFRHLRLIALSIEKRMARVSKMVFQIHVF